MSIYSLHIETQNLEEVSTERFVAQFQARDSRGVLSFLSQVQDFYFSESSIYAHNAQDCELGLALFKRRNKLRLKTCTLGNLVSTPSEFDLELFKIGGQYLESGQKGVSICFGGHFTHRNSLFGQLRSSLRSAYKIVYGKGSTATMLELSDERFLFIRSNLIGYMFAQCIALCFKSRRHWESWLEDGVELSFIKRNHAFNSNKMFVLYGTDEVSLEEFQNELDEPNCAIFDEHIILEMFETHASNYIPVHGGMVLIPSGEYDGVRIDRPFLMSQGEVTTKLYASINKHALGDSELPQGGISWRNCLELANNLSEQGTECYEISKHMSGGITHYNLHNLGFRLPTSEEWVYACKALCQFEYSGSNAPAHIGMYYASLPLQVGSRNPNAFGLYDMSGNMAEWCWENEHEATLRGGNFRSSHLEIQTTSFISVRVPLEQISDTFGCRLVRNLY